MKISKALLETILPITIVTFIVIACFFINQFLFTEPNIACETYQLSNTTYLIYTMILIVSCSFYQILVGNYIIKHCKNNFSMLWVNSLSFTLFFSVILILINLFQRKIEWDFFLIFFLIFFIYGLLLTIVIKLWRRFLLRRNDKTARIN